MLYQIKLFLAKREWQFIFFNAYLLMIIFTFGHAVNHSDSINTVDKGITSIPSAIAWPLYWSVQLQK